MSTPDTNQISILEKQCGYVPFLMNKSKVVRTYLWGLLIKFVLFIGLCALVKWNEMFLALLIIYSVFVLIDTYIRAFACMKKHMINHLDKAIIAGTGVVMNKKHNYPNKLIRLMRRYSNDDRDAMQYNNSYYSSLEVLVNGNENKWYTCTNMTYEHATAGDKVIILEFPEEYELGKYCCFLEKIDF